MPRSSLQRRSFWILTLLTPVFTGCGGEKKPSGSDGDEKQVDVAEVKEEIKELLPAAAGMPYRDFELLATSATPSMDRFDNQPLSLVLLSLRSDWVDESEDRLRAEFQYASATPKPSSIAEAMIVSRNKGYASVIQPDYIDELTCEVDDGTASGQVTFTIKDCFKATVHFAAAKRDDNWQLTEFSLPMHQAKTVLGDNGKWKASGTGVTEPPVYVQLPLVAGLPPREDSSNRLVLYVGRGSGQDRDEFFVGIGDKKISQAKARDILAPALGEFCKQKRISAKDVIAVIRADRQVPAGIVQQVMQRAMELGVEQFRLQSRMESDNENDDLYPSIGEAVFQFPLAADEFEKPELLEELDLNDVEPIESIPSLDVSPAPVGVEQPRLDSPLPKLDGCQPKEEFLPPLRVRLKAAEDGSLIEIGVEQWILGNDISRLQQRLKEFVGVVGAEAAIEIDVDYELRYDDFMKVISACSGYKQDDGKWVPLVEKLILAPPRHSEG